MSHNFGVMENLEVKFTIVEEEELKTENNNGVLTTLSREKMIRNSVKVANSGNKTAEYSYGTGLGSSPTLLLMLGPL